MLARGLELEVLDPQRIGVAPHRIDAFADDLEAHVLEHRQRDVELDRLVALDGREPQALGAIGGRAHERDLEVARALVDQRELLDVRAGTCCVGLVLIRGREVLAVAVQQVERALLGQLRQQRLAHAVLPSAHRVLELALQRRDVGLGVLPGTVRTVTARRASADSEIVSSLSTALPPRPVEQDRLDRAARARVVLVARQVDEARVEAAERLAPHEQLELVAVLEAEHAAADHAQVVERRLEKIVARQRVQDVLQRLAAMAARVEPGLVHQRADLQAQQRDRPRALVVRDRREQAEEPALAASACRRRRTP